MSKIDDTPVVVAVAGFRTVYQFWFRLPVIIQLFSSDFRKEDVRDFSEVHRCSVNVFVASAAGKKVSTALSIGLISMSQSNFNVRCGKPIARKFFKRSARRIYE